MTEELGCSSSCHQPSSCTLLTPTPLNQVAKPRGTYLGGQGIYRFAFSLNLSSELVHGNANLSLGCWLMPWPSYDNSPQEVIVCMYKLYKKCRSARSRLRLLDDIDTRSGPETVCRECTCQLCANILYNHAASTGSDIHHLTIMQYHEHASCIADWSPLITSYSVDT